jgi:uncharacterized protein YqhQ
VENNSAETSSLNIPCHNKPPMSEKAHLGGQAVIEGVMIKSQNNYVVCVRKGTKIITKKGKIRKRPGVSKVPFIRGFVNLVDMLVIGTKALVWSADQQDGKAKTSKGEIFSVIGISFLFAILFFIALPYFLTVLLGIREETKPLIFNLTDGFIRIALFLLYIFGISFLKDVRRLFQYHGAEHKAVNCFEDGKNVTISNASRYSTLHLRCGTNFIMITLIISILAFSVLPTVVVYLFPNFLDMNLWLRKSFLFLLRLGMLPLIAGISYEFIRLSDKFSNNKIINAASKPGLWLQKITTKEPNKKQMEVAIKAVKSISRVRRPKKQKLFKLKEDTL